MYLLIHIAAIAIRSFQVTLINNPAFAVQLYFPTAVVRLVSDPIFLHQLVLPAYRGRGVAYLELG